MESKKKNIAWFWQNAERILIVIFFLTFSCNIRKVFLTPYSFLNGGFNEYLTLSFSWTDLLMLVTIVIYTTKYILRQVINPYYAYPDHRNGVDKTLITVSRETFYLLILLAWIGLSIFWSQYRTISIYRFLTFIEIILFASIAVKSLKNSRWLKIALFALILNGLFQSVLGIAQFVHNSSLGLHFLGESILGPNIDGVAKILIEGQKHIRAYGTFPHPNMLAGFLLIPFLTIISELVSRIFFSIHMKNLPSHQAGVSNRSAEVSHETILGPVPAKFLWLSFFLIGTGFALTFSRSAFLGLFFGVVVYIIIIAHPQRLIIKRKSTFKILGFFFIVLILMLVALLTTTSIFSNQSLQERKLYQYVSYETIMNHPVQGTGIGQFALNEFYLHPNLESWQYQPVHNLYLLVFSEVGIIGFVLLLLFLLSIVLRVDKNLVSGENCKLTCYLFYCIVLSFLVVSLFDHYFWDIKIGTIIFIIPLMFLYVVRKNLTN